MQLLYCLFLFVQIPQECRKTFSNKYVQLKIVILFQKLLLYFHLFHIIMLLCCLHHLHLWIVLAHSDLIDWRVVMCSNGMILLWIELHRQLIWSVSFRSLNRSCHLLCQDDSNKMCFNVTKADLCISDKIFVSTQEAYYCKYFLCAVIWFSKN